MTAAPQKNNLASWSWDYISSELKHDKQFALNLVQQNAVALDYAPDLFRKDKNFVLEEVKLNGEALQYVKLANLTNEKEIVLEAIRQNMKAFQYVPEDLFLDHHFMLTVLKALFPEEYYG